MSQSLLGAELIELDQGEAKTREHSLDDASRLNFGWLRPGRHRLRILADDRVLLHSEIIHVQPGTNLWPPDGSRLDLRGSARAIFVGAGALDGVALVPPLRVVIGATSPQDLLLR